MRVTMLTNDSQMIDRRILQEAATLVAGGHAVHLLAGFECPEPGEYVAHGTQIHRYNYDWDDERLKKIRALLPRNDRVIALVNRAFMFLARRFFRITPFQRFILEKAYQYPADVVHVHDLPMLLPGLVLARGWGVPLVYDAHELYYAQEVLPKAIQKAYFKLEKKLICQADVVITVNEFIAQLMAERYRIARPYVLYNAAAVPATADSAAVPSLRARVGGTGPIILFQGWLSAERNIETLVRAMPHIAAPAVLAIIGYGGHEPALRQLAHALGVQERVHFLGAVPSDEMLHYTRGAALGVIPYLPIDDNHRFCSPNKFFEYVLAGVPILAHELAFFQSMAERYGVVECTDFTSPEAVGSTINRLLRAGELDRMRTRCTAAGKILNWTTEGEKLLELYTRFGRQRTAA
jgi:glycosyltransferase involved in cell wall biosynthesis